MVLSEELVSAVSPSGEKAPKYSAEERKAAPWLVGFRMPKPFSHKAMMPEMRWLEATRLLKTDPRYSGMPVVGVTGNCDAEGTRACLEAGMAAVLAKPIDTAAIFQLL